MTNTRVKIGEKNSSFSVKVAQNQVAIAIEIIFQPNSRTLEAVTLLLTTLKKTKKVIKMNNIISVMDELCENASIMIITVWGYRLKYACDFATHKFFLSTG